MVVVAAGVPKENPPVGAVVVVAAVVEVVAPGVPKENPEPLGVAAAVVAAAAGAPKEMPPVGPDAVVAWVVVVVEAVGVAPTLTPEVQIKIKKKKIQLTITKYRTTCHSLVLASLQL